MKPGIIVAGFISVLFVSGALWIRFIEGGRNSSSLVAVENAPLPENYYDDLLTKFITATSTEPGEKLTTTDLIGRQMILEYLSLAQTGQATSDNIIKLAEKYVESIPTINNAPGISYSEINPVSDSKSNFDKYASAANLVYEKYRTQIAAAYPSRSSMENLDSKFYSSLEDISNAYEEAALNLKSTAVPISIATKHYNLINTFLSNASALKALSESGNDSAKAFAAIVLLSENVGEENILVREIDTILLKNGI